MNFLNDLRVVSDPVSVSDGKLIGSDIDFAISFDIPVIIDRHYSSAKSNITPLGRSRFSSIDSFIIADENDPKLLHYFDGLGRDVHFARPIPSPGKYSSNNVFRGLKLYAGKNRQLILKEQKLTTYFQKFDDGKWRIQSIEDRCGNKIIYTYIDINLAKITVPNGLSFEFLYQNNLRTQIYLIGRLGTKQHILSYEYDSRKNLSAVIHHYGKSFKFLHDEKDQLVEWTDSFGTHTKHYYDDQKRVVKTITNGPYNGDAFSYDENGITHFFPEGKKEKEILFFSDHNRQVYREIHPLGKEVLREYNQNRQLVSEINGEGNITSYEYDQSGNITFINDGEGREHFYSYDEWGNLKLDIDGRGRKWRYRYDENGSLVAIISPEDKVLMEINNDDFGRPVAVMRSDGYLQQMKYNEFGDLIISSDFSSARSKYNYDEFGRLTTIIDAMGHETSLFYKDIAGYNFWQASAIRRPDGALIELKIDKNGTQYSTKDGENRNTTYNYGPFALLKTIEDAKGGKLEFTYDGQEKLASVTNQLGQKWLFERDAAGRVVKEIDFSGLTQKYIYDKADRIIEVQYVDGAKILFEYDQSGLLIKEQAYAPDGQLQDETNYNYDDSGLLTRTENNSAVISFIRDKLGRVSQEKLNGRAVDNIFDCCGRRVGRLINDKNFVKTLYDPMGRFSELTIGDHAALKMTLDPLGRELKRESAAGFVLNQSYDVLGQLKSQIGGFAIASLGRGLEGAMAAQQQGIDPSKATSQVERYFNWNKSFEPLAIDDKRWGNTSYNYDANGQIVESTSIDGTVERFRYDSALNISGFSGGNTADTAKFEQWLSRQGGAISEAKGPNGERVHLTYDSRNRVIERRVEKNGFRIKIWKYQWDAKNRLIGCIPPTGERWTYHYDPFGRRIFKINASIAQKALLAQSPNVTELEKNRGAYHEDKHQRGSGDMSGETIVGTAYLWDAHTIAEEAPLKASGEADWDKATKWHYEPNTFRPIAKETANSELFYIVNDHLGTPREMFSEDGKLVWAAQYRTWGAIHKIWQADNDNDIRGPYPPPIRGNLAFKYDTVEAQAAQTCPIRFQGQWEDAETGLYYNRYRYYDPLAAQYISPDPIGLAGGLRSNGYVHNPNAWIDPWGLARAPVPVPCCGPSGNLDWSGVDKHGVSRKDHVIAHETDIPTKDIQGVFSNNAITQVEDAWAIAKQQGIIPTLDKYGNWKYTIPAPGAGIMGGVEGAKLGNPILNNVTIITKPGTNHVITAFPSL
ncbi:RHS domain-containing protein [Bartonella sp. HY329]|uniref:RHS repeat-associated core domain-containing protein n=1 Tax=unclassified Bartonella TaxID=2645622 RepID=UPI0021C9739B|nr:MULTISPECIES: RHS repeat-associated core domain-containing protein [unclassified Bartonella]UXM96196.1 RHS domain-containing protein [Bartonella sp. HY329]UXN10520.1 RHS domain-containing protein [Bartonella sp. HY328]